MFSGILKLTLFNMNYYLTLFNMNYYDIWIA
jgi:hypothetical protein